MDPTLQDQIEEVILAAEEIYKQYPQYAGYWRSPDWKPVRLKKNIRTKAGQSFLSGEVTIAKLSTIPTSLDESIPTVVAYSPLTGFNTAVYPDDVEWL